MTVDVIAEFGQSHGGTLNTAITQAAVAKDAGCTYAKWQTFAPERLCSPNAPRYWDTNLGGAATQLATFRQNGMLAAGDWETLADYCHSIGLGFMSSPFDLQAVDLLVDAGVGALKIASGEITHRQLLQRVADTGLPVVLSTGASTVAEIDQALDWLVGVADLTLLACTLSYPTAEADAELGRIRALVEAFPLRRLRFGYSDHTLRVDTAMAAVVAGATMLEKHCRLDESDGVCPDDRMALDPVLLRQYVAYARLGERMLGTGVLEPTEAELAARAGARRSLHAARDIGAGERFGPDDFVCLRPAGPFEPSDVDVLVGKTAARDISVGEQIRQGDVV